MFSNHLKTCLALFLIALGCVSCNRPQGGRPQSTSIATPTAHYQPTPEITCGSYIPDQFGQQITTTEREIHYSKAKLDYLGYEISLAVRRVDMNAGDRAAPRLYEDVPYVHIKRRGKLIAKFLGVAEHLVETQFGLVSLLGGTDQQLVIEQTANKYWRYWIVNLRPRFEIIYDSGKYDLVYWLRTIDFDHDGRFELVQNLGSFWYILGDNSRSPRPEIILQYDSHRRKYVPSNARFQSEILKDIDRRIERGEEIKRISSHSCPAVVYDVMVRYVYAGREREAWKFFEREYGEGDKAKKRSTIKTILAKQKVYHTT